MFLDMVGYSAMMSKDEARALACVGELEKLLRAEIPRHGGRLVKFLGDGSMAEFPTALSSVTCSQNVLAAIEANNAWVAPENRYAVRIGLHLGELVDVQDDIFSDTVNVAQRLEASARPGSVVLWVHLGAARTSDERAMRATAGQRFMAALLRGGNDTSRRG